MNITGLDSIGKILIVDDEKANLQLLSDILSDAGYKVRPANNGELALRSVNAKLPDLILLDIKMPGMDGLEVCRQLKADEKTCSIPVIFISVLKDETSKTKGFQAGAVDFITKPFYSEEVLARVKTHLSFNQLQLNLKSQNAQLLKDITERKRAEEALRKSEEKFSKLFFSNPSWMAFATLKEGRLLEVNEVFEEITGFDREEVIGRTSLEIGLWHDPRDRERLAKLAEEKEGFQEEEVTFLTRKGDLISCLWSTDIIELDGEACLLSTVMDISELKRAQQEKTKLQDQLHQAQKMEALGLMAGAVAHDLNNILGGIVAYPDLILMDLPEESPLREPIEVIKDSGKRAVDVVADLMTITRGVATGKEVWNLNDLAGEYLNSGEHKNLEKMRPSVVFKTELDTELLNITCSPTHIKKSLMNLVTNASEVIGGGGTVTISTANQYLDEPLKGYEDVRIGEYTVLSVSDDGSGISPEDLERIFEPFYTKKVMGKSGTGLGLTIVWNTVQDHNGYIDVKTSERGTIFDLYFPVTRDELTQGEEEVPREDYQGHGERILVVDDEEKQREIACWLLTRLGYVAEAVSSGEEAIAYVKEHPVDLIVLDMAMPKGINGRKTYEEIIKIRPEQKAIITSGFAKTKEVDIAQELGAGKYIKKPYILEKIGVAVKEELEK